MHLVLTSNMRLLFIGQRSIAAKQWLAKDIILICAIPFQGNLQLVIFFSVVPLDGIDLLAGFLAGRFEPRSALVLASLVPVLDRSPVLLDLVFEGVESILCFLDVLSAPDANVLVLFLVDRTVFVEFLVLDVPEFNCLLVLLDLLTGLSDALVVSVSDR